MNTEILAAGILQQLFKPLTDFFDTIGLGWINWILLSWIFEAIGLLILFLLIRAILNYGKKGKTQYKQNVTIPSLLPFQEGNFRIYEEEGNLYLELKPDYGTVEELFDKDNEFEEDNDS